MQKATRAILLLLLIGFSVEASFACRFNVRETGFVDLGLESYLLICYTDAATSREFVTTFQETAEEVLSETNVIYELVDTEAQQEHPAMKFLPQLEQETFPAVLLLSPRGSVLASGFEISTDTGVQSLGKLISQVVDSQLRTSLMVQLSRAYGVVLLIEGEEAAANAQAEEVVEEAISEIESQMKFMPKPISHGPVSVTLSRDSFSDERFLTWSLGLQPEDLVEPHVAVLYGKGRWIGPLLRGSEIEPQILVNILSVIGADCECGLDPRLIRGTALPVRWDRTRQDEVAEDLGFDPENPMIKIEVSQILKLRGRLHPTVPSGPPPSLDDLPVPFVEDRDENPVMKNVLWVLAGLGGLVVVVGLIMALKMRGKRR
jgi:hypothetical protein